MKCKATPPKKPQLLLTPTRKTQPRTHNPHHSHPAHFLSIKPSNNLTTTATSSKHLKTPQHKHQHQSPTSSSSPPLLLLLPLLPTPTILLNLRPNRHKIPPAHPLPQPLPPPHHPHHLNPNHPRRHHRYPPQPPRGRRLRRRNPPPNPVDLQHRQRLSEIYPDRQNNPSPL